MKNIKHDLKEFCITSFMTLATVAFIVLWCYIGYNNVLAMQENCECYSQFVYPFQATLYIIGGAVIACLIIAIPIFVSDRLLTKKYTNGERLE